MDYNCTLNFTSTNGCQALLNLLRHDSAEQVNTLIQGSIVLSVETGIYSELKNALLRGRLN